MSVSEDRKQMPAVPDKFQPKGGSLTGRFSESNDDLVGAVDRAAVTGVQDALQRMIAGPGALAGGHAGLAALAMAKLGLDGANGDKKREADLQTQLQRVNEYLEHLRERIDDITQDIQDLQIERLESIARSDGAYARMRELDLLRESIKDGVSAEEEAALERLLGDKLKGAKPEDLDGIIAAASIEELKNGLQADEDVEILDQKILDKENDRNELMQLESELSLKANEMQQAADNNSGLSFDPDQLIADLTLNEGLEAQTDVNNSLEVATTLPTQTPNPFEM